MGGMQDNEGSYLAPVTKLVGEGEGAGFHLAASPDGRLTRREGGLDFRFSFRFRDRPFSAEAHAVGDEIRVTVAGDFGVLPFTLENRERRDEILKLLPQLKKSGLTCEITRAQQIRIGSDIALTGVQAPRDILAAVIERLILARGSFDAMSAIAYVPVKPVRRLSRP